MSAGGGGPRAEAVRGFLRDHPEVECVDPGGGNGIRDALKEFSRRDCDVIAVSGGDGTLQRTLTELLSNGEMFENMPLIAPLRAGRTNMSALDIGSDRKPARALARLARGARDGSLDFRIVSRPVLRVDLGGGQAPQYGMFCGVGVIHRAIELTHSVFPYGRSQGVLGSSLVTLSLLLRSIFGGAAGILNPDPLAIRLDGERVAGAEFRLVLATTLNRLFLRLNPFWGLEKAPIRFTALDPASTRNVRTIARVVRGSPPRKRRDFEDSGGTSRNVFTGELQLDCGLTIDGEMFDPLPGRTVTIAADERLRFVHS
jgi:diacylglycerol kinase (ATP)